MTMDDKTRQAHRLFQVAYQKLHQAQSALDEAGGMVESDLRSDANYSWGYIETAIDQMKVIMDQHGIAIPDYGERV